MARYERIAAALRKGILAGRYTPGERLPPQRDLAARWKTTLPTVRQALDTLREEGLLRVEHGVGTFIADLDRAHDPFAVASFTEALREHGLEVETRLVAAEPRARSAEAAAALGLAPSSALLAFTRLRLVGGLPIVYQHSYIAGRYRAALGAYTGDVPLYAFIRQRVGLHAGAYRETLTAEPTPGAIAEALGLLSGAPIGVARRVTATAEGLPFVYDEAYLPPARVRVTISRVGVRCTAELTPMLAVLLHPPA